MYADIILDISHEKLDKTFQYEIPEELEGQVAVGTMVMVPFGRGNREQAGYVVALSGEPALAKEKIKPVSSVVNGRVGPVSRMIELAAWLRENYGSTMVQALKTVMPVKAKITRRFKRTLVLACDETTAQAALAEFKKKHAVARERLFAAVISSGRLDYDLARTRLNIQPATMRELEQMGLIDIEEKEVYRTGLEPDTDTLPAPQLTMNADQKRCVDAVVSDFDAGHPGTYLLYGVTGSGKTLCYLEMASHMASAGCQSIVLIPEIALTFQTVRRFQDRFGSRVAILHSRMSQGERYDTYLRAMKGEVDVVVGPRSALFVPLPKVGLIVIDEEQEESYASEQSPRYHAREVAQHIADEMHASLVLGSATPSLTSFYRAQTGKYRLLTLPNRATAQTLPAVRVADMREELKKGNRTPFSLDLAGRIQERLEKHEQTMLFLNRRGYLGHFACYSCGKPVKCPHCDVAMTLHVGPSGKWLSCHYCGYTAPVPKVCPVCGSVHVGGMRAGTENIEAQVKRLFPQAHVLRMDADTTAGKDGHEKILSAFANHEADILVGTQMIVKGHDFPDVTLVGIVNADLSLFAPDYKAPERTFDLLVQAAGRAGRGKRPGEVVIQTYSPNNYTIETAARQDYLAFYEHEIAYRRLLGYPPVKHMLTILLSAADEQRLSACAEMTGSAIREALKGKPDTDCTGPARDVIARIKDSWRQVICVRSASRSDLVAVKDLVDARLVSDPKFAKIFVQYQFDD